MRKTAQVLVELLRGAESRGLCPERVLEKYSFEVSHKIVEEVLSNVTGSESGVGFFKWASKQVGFQHSTHVCNCLLRVLVDDKRPAEAHRLFNDALLSAYDPSVDTYNLLIRGYCEAGEMWKAFRLLEEMKERNLEPDEVTHCVILKGFCSLGRATEALSHFKTVTESSAIHVDMYNTLIHGLCKENRIDRAYQLFEEMDELGWKPSLPSSTMIIHGLCEVGKVGEALKLFNEMEQTPSLATLNSMVSGLCKVGRAEEARDMVQGKYKELVNVVTYGLLIDGLCKTGRVEDALKVFEQMVGNGLRPDSPIFNSIIGAFCKLNMLDEALVFLQMIKASRWCAPDTATFGSLVNGLCKVNRSADALQLVEEMTGMRCVPNAHIYSTLVEGLCRSGKVGEACNLIERMLGEGCVPSAQAYGSVTDGLFETEKPKEAVLQLQRIMDWNKSVPKFVTLSSLIDVLCKSGRQLEAGWFLRMNTQAGFKPNVQVFNALLQGLCRTGEMEEALELVSQASQEFELAVASYNILMGGFCKIVKVESACEVFVWMVNRGCSPTTVTYDILTDGFSKSGRMAEEYQFTEQADEVPAGLKILLTRLHKPEHAFQVICRMVEKGLLKLITLNSIIQELCKADKHDDANELTAMLVKVSGMSPFILRAAITDG